MKSDDMQNQYAPDVGFNLPALFAQIDKAKHDVSHLSYYLLQGRQHQQRVQELHHAPSNAPSDCASSASNNLSAADGHNESCRRLLSRHRRARSSASYNTITSNEDDDEDDDLDVDEEEDEGEEEQEQDTVQDNKTPQQTDADELIDIETTSSNGSPNSTLSAAPTTTTTATGEQRAAGQSATVASNSSIYSTTATTTTSNSQHSSPDSRQSFAVLLIRHMVQKRNELKYIDKQLYELITQCVFDLSSSAAALHLLHVSPSPATDSEAIGDELARASEANAHVAFCLPQPYVHHNRQQPASASSYITMQQQEQLHSSYAANYQTPQQQGYDSREAVVREEQPLCGNVAVDLRTEFSATAQAPQDLKNQNDEVNDRKEASVAANSSGCSAGKAPDSLPPHEAPVKRQAQSQAINLKKLRLLANITLSNNNSNAINSANDSNGFHTSYHSPLEARILAKTTTTEPADSQTPSSQFNEALKEQDNPLNLLNKHERHQFATTADSLASLVTCANSFAPQQAAATAKVPSILSDYCAKNCATDQIAAPTIAPDIAIDAVRRASSLRLQTNVVPVPQHSHSVHFQSPQSQPQQPHDFLVNNSSLRISSSSLFAAAATSSALNHIHQSLQMQQLSTNVVAPVDAVELTSVGSAASVAAAVAASHFKVSYRCHVCGSFFEDRHRLQQHLSIHLQLNKDWYTESTIKKTMTLYESKRGDYLCPSCDLRFATTSTFDKHMQLHGDKPHRCELCFHDNSFRYYRQYLTHYRNHCVIYKCKFVDDCNHQCNRRDYLKSHILKHHLNNKLPPQYTIYCH